MTKNASDFPYDFVENFIENQFSYVNTIYFLYYFHIRVIIQVSLC